VIFITVFLKSEKSKHKQPPAHAGSPLADFSTLKMVAIRSSETSVNARSTQRHIPEDDILHRYFVLLEGLGKGLERSEVRCTHAGM
jgi:hypothetical protein